MAQLNVNELSKTLKSVNARWEAGQAQDRALGFRPGPADLPLEEREHQARVNHAKFMAATAAPAGAAALPPPPYPPSFDWRAAPPAPPRPAGNYVSAIRDQSTCGSCVAFGTAAAIEASKRIAAHNPGLGIDLSEADLFYCHAEPAGRRCDGPNGGWWPDAALAVAQSTGVVDESCFPYTPGDQPCKRCADWAARLTKITAWHKIPATTDMKTWIANHGPLITCFSVYDDFLHYKSGVYHHVSGALKGGHCVCCVGYDDVQRFWICKNSWGTGFGESGFFRIAYGQVGIDAVMWAVEP